MTTASTAAKGRASTEPITAEHLLGQIACELEELHEFCIRLEGAVAVCIDAATAAPVASMAELQSIDLLRQSLADLAIAAERGAHGTTTAELADALQLEALRIRLLGLSGTKPVEPGEVTFL